MHISSVLYKLLALALLILCGKTYASQPLTRIEGLWLFGNGATVRIESDANSHLRLIMVSCVDPLVETPVEIGTGTFAGKENAYVLTIKRTFDPETGRPGKKTARVLATLHSDEPVMELRDIRSGYRLNLLRMFPYLFRISVTKDEPMEGLEGAVRIDPPGPNSIIPPVL